MCRAHRAALMVANVSRLTRSVAFLSNSLEADVEIRFVDLPSIEGATGRFILQQMASVAELEAGIHVASMTMARHLAQAKTMPEQESAESGFNKLTRTFADQVEALKNYRSKGEQKMTVQHVHVGEGGQAIVGNVNAPSRGGGGAQKSEVQPHALAYAPGVEMPRHVEKERETVPIAGGWGL